jgi:alpha-beta hydrolase superfamily lysophospholipase
MNENIFDFSTTDGTSLKAVTWDNTESPKAILAIVHGHGEHKMRYKHVAEHFTKSGYQVYAMDNRGHGESSGKKGHSPSHDQLIDDVEQFLAAIRSTHNDLPIILYGHSMGGNIVANYVLKRKTSELAGVVLTSPMFKLAFDPPKWKVTLGNMMANIWPSLVQPTGLETKHISTDLDEVKKYEDDTLIHDKMSAGLFTGLIEGGEWAVANASELTTATLVMHGTDDQIISYEGSKMFAQNAGEKVTLKLWEGMYHELQNEKEKEKVLDFMLNWTEQLVLGS